MAKTKEGDKVLEAMGEVDDNGARSVVDQASQALGGLGGTVKKKAREAPERGKTLGGRVKKVGKETGFTLETFEEEEPTKKDLREQKRRAFGL